MILKPRRNVLIPTHFGMMMVNRFDYNDKENFNGVGYHLLNSGTENIDSIPILRKFFQHKSSPVTIDVGANIGAFCIQVAQLAEEKKGIVYAYEPQRQMFQMLNGNLALNSIDNVFTIQAAVGNKEGTITIPKLDYYKPGSFGSVGLTGDFDDVGQDLDFGNGEKVPLVTLDSNLKHLDNIDVIKVDVEGMEKEVIEGSLNLINKHRPLLYVEYIKQLDGGNSLVDFIKSLNYEIFVAHINILCIPKEKIDSDEYKFVREMKNGN